MTILTHTLTLAQERGALDRLIFGNQVGNSNFVESHDWLFMFIFWLCVLMFVVLMGAAAYFTLKYRYKPGVPQQRSASHNTPLELAWSIGPLIVMAFLFVWGFQGFMDAHVAPSGSEIVNVQAQKWAWNLEYDNGATTREFTTDLFGEEGQGKQVPVFAVPAGRPIKLQMISSDVIHSFWVPSFRMKFDVFPNRYTTMWFEAQTPTGPDPKDGLFLFCAEYCGAEHSQMAGIIKVLDPHDYNKWKQEMGVDTRPPVEKGASLYVTKACNSCHSVDGTPNTGPTWLDLFGKDRVFTNGSTGVADENYIRESILEPARNIVEGYPNQMNSYQGQLTEAEIRSLIAYMKTLSEAGRAALTPEETTSSEESEGAEEPESGA